MDTIRRPTSPQRTKVGLWVIPFVLTMPFVLLLMGGELLARPLEKHRHKSVSAWLLWNIARLLGGLLAAVLLGALGGLVIGWLRHRPA